MGNVNTNDVVTNAKNSSTEAKQGSVVTKSKIGQTIDSEDTYSKITSLTDLESRLENKFDEVDYYDIPEALNGGGFTPTPSPTPTLTPTPTPTPTPIS